MPHVTLEIADFVAPFDPLNSPATSIDGFSRWDIARALFTLGSQRSGAINQMRRHGVKWFLNHQLLNPYFFAWSYCATSSDSLHVDRNFFTLSATEKAIISRKCGEAFTKLYAERVLLVPKLVVLEAMRSVGAAAISYALPGNARPKEPDMIGQSRRSEWHVLEAKGSSNFNSREQLWKHGKEQALNISMIEGRAPATRSVCMTFLDQGQFHTILRDPDGDSGKSAEVTLRGFDSHYYGFFLNARRSQIVRTLQIRNERFEVVSIQTRFEQVQFGVASRVLDRASEGTEMSSLESERFRALSRESNDGYSIGSDGLILLAV